MDNPNNNSNNQNKSQAPDTDRSRNIMKIIGVILVIIVVAALASGKWTNNRSVKDDDSALSEGCEKGELFSETTGKPCPVDDDSDKDDVADKKDDSDSLTYDQAIAAYAGKMISFSNGCEATPKTQTLALGSRVLLANNSTEILTLALDTKTVTLRPYHYATTSLKTAGTFKANCNTKEAATVTVQ